MASTTFSIGLVDEEAVFISYANVCVFNRYFKKPVELVQKWLLNAGHSIVTDPAKASVQISFPMGIKIPGLKFVIINTEQPGHHQFKNKDVVQQYQNSDVIWCMDNVDYTYFQEILHIPSNKLKILPVMFGTYYFNVPYGLSTAKQYDVLQFGCKNPRRIAIMDEIDTKRPGSKLYFTETTFNTNELWALICSARVVVIPSFYNEPVTFGLHRLAFLMKIPNVVYVVEDAATSVFNRQILELCNLFCIVPYEKLVETTIEALETDCKNTAPTSLLTFAENLQNWDGVLSWTVFLELASTISFAATPDSIAGQIF